VVELISSALAGVVGLVIAFLVAALGLLALIFLALIWDRLGFAIRLLEQIVELQQTKTASTSTPGSYAEPPSAPRQVSPAGSSEGVPTFRILG
jgi:hypothetical protein